VLTGSRPFAAETPVREIANIVRGELDTIADAA
jgi:hypothetical protein